MARSALAVLPLALGLAACGGGDSRAQTQPGTARAAQAAAPVREAVVVYSPARGKVVTARPFRDGRLQAVVRASGRAAPGQQLEVRGACGGYSCAGITFADSDGRWRTRVLLVTPSKRRRAVGVSVGYADPASGEVPARFSVRLRRGTPAPAPAPRPAPEAEPETGGQSAPATDPAGDAPRTVIVIGDSLAIGMASPLRGLLEGWNVSVDGRTGRPLAEGMELLAETALPAGAEGRRAILAFSLFTNDGPQNVDALEAAVRESVRRLGPKGCAIWATIARPPFMGTSYDAANARLARLAQDPALAGRLLVVPWKREYARRPSWQAGDGVHATPEGYAGRAQLYADAARACPA